MTTKQPDGDPSHDLAAHLADQVEELVRELRENRSPREAKDAVYVPKWLAAAVIGTMISLTVAAGASLIALHARVGLIEGTRFTHQMGTALEERARTYHDTRPSPTSDATLQRLMEHERRLQQQSERLQRLEQRGGGL